MVLFLPKILSPFIEEEKMIEIFGENLFEKQELKDTFIELCGFGEIKPFECVGTYSEVRYSTSRAIEKYISEGKELPYLLNFYNMNYKLENTSIDILKKYNVENNLPDEFSKILKENL